MATFTSFEDIDAWRESRLLIRKIREICRKENVKKDFAFVDQITRSARSIAANIAEGFESMTVPEFINLLGYAKRSAGETGSHLYDALEEQYVSKDEFQVLREQTRKIGKMIAGLVHYLQTVDQKKKRTLLPDASKTKNQ